MSVVITMFLKRETSIALPFLVVQQSILLHNFCIPLVVPSVLSGDGEVGTMTVFATLERLQGRSIAGPTSSFFHLEVNFFIVDAKVRMSMTGSLNEFHFNGTRVSRVWLSSCN